MTSPRVRYLLPNLRRGGTERRVCRLATVGTKRGLWHAELSLMYSAGAAEDDPALVAALDAAAIPVQRLAMGGLRRPAEWPAFWRGAREFRRSLRFAAPDSTPDILHAFLPSCNLLALAPDPRMRPMRRPRVVISQSALGHYRDKRLGLRALEDLLYPRAAAVLCNSKAVRDDLLARIPRLHPERCHIVHNGVETPAPEAVSTAVRAAGRREIGARDDDFVFLMLANLISYKGHETAIEALARALPPRRNGFPPSRRVFLVGVGADPQGRRADLERRAGELGVGGSVRFIGEQTEPARWLGAADALVSASTEEGFSNSILEAMMAGLPVIATRVGGTPEALGEGSRWLVASGDAEALAGALREAIADPDAARAEGERLAARARERFSIDAMLAAMSELYARVSSRS